MICRSCDHDHEGAVYGFICLDCQCPGEPGRAEWIAAIEANIPASPSPQRRALAQRLIDLADDAAHWNRQHPNDEPIVVDTDIRKDVAMVTARLVKGGKA